MLSINHLKDNATFQLMTLQILGSPTEAIAPPQSCSEKHGWSAECHSVPCPVDCFRVLLIYFCTHSVDKPYPTNDAQINANKDAIFAASRRCIRSVSSKIRLQQCTTQVETCTACLPFLSGHGLQITKLRDLNKIIYPHHGSFQGVKSSACVNFFGSLTSCKKNPKGMEINCS